MNKSALLCVLTLSSFQASALDLQLGATQQNVVLDVWQQTNGTRGQEIVSLRSPYKWGPSIGLNSEDRKISEDSNFSYYYFAGYNRGVVSILTTTDVAIPSSIPVNEVHAGATIFYGIGEENVSGRHRIGLGLGGGYLKANGTVPSQYTNTGSAENINISSIGLAVDVFYSYTWDNWFFYAGGKAVAASATPNRDYQITGVNITFGRIFNLDALPSYF